MRIIIQCILLAIFFTLVSCFSVPTRDTLNSGQSPLSGYGAYGYVVFTKRPIDIPSSHEKAFCEAYRVGLEPTSSYGYLARSSLMPTYWLLDAKSPSNNSCELLVKNYGYAKAKLIASSVHKLDTAGPILVAWRSSFEKSEGQEALVLDLSGIQTEQYPEIIGIWSSRIARSPNMWNDGFNLEKIRIEFKSFLNANGDSIVSVIEWFKEIAS